MVTAEPGAGRAVRGTVRKRRRTRYTWLPVLPQVNNLSGTDFYVQTREFNTNITAGGDPGLVIFPVTTDFSREDVNVGGSQVMGEILQSDYFLRRIVGKLHLSYSQDIAAYASNQPPIWPAVLVTAGFFVARAASDATVGFVPIGITTGVTIEDFNNYNPLASATVREPWIWRRTWTLGNNYDAFAFAGTLNSGEAFFPANNANYGSVLDGPHIDAKTARRVKNDERLWFAVGIVPVLNSLPPGKDVPANANSAVYGTLDVRLLGAQRKAKNSGAF